jgi:hypothetical protein
MLVFLFITHGLVLFPCQVVKQIDQRRCRKENKYAVDEVETDIEVKIEALIGDDHLETPADD